MSIDDTRTAEPLVPATQRPATATVPAKFRAWLQRTHQRSLPGLIWLLISRMAVIFAILAAYSWFRKTYFQRSAEVAFRNAVDLIDYQSKFGVAVTKIEIPLQQWVINHPPLVDFFNTYYRQFKPALYLCAALCLLLAPAGFRRVRRVFVIATLIALPCYALIPLAPPRLMDAYGFNFVDTLAQFAGVHSSATGAGGANQFAAMPSMHIGWSTIGAMWLAAALPWRHIGAVIGALHVGLMCLTVMATGNHYLFDILGGFLVAGSSWLVARSLPETLPGFAWLDRFGTQAPQPSLARSTEPRMQTNESLVRASRERNAS